MKLSNIYLNAAKKVDVIAQKQDFHVATAACRAINDTAWTSGLGTRRSAILGFYVVFGGVGSYLWDFPASRYVDYLRQQQDARVFALLLMHEMAKDYEQLLKGVNHG